MADAQDAAAAKRLAEREKRLAAALRDNLKRRKSQARARASAPPCDIPDTAD